MYENNDDIEICDNKDNDQLGNYWTQRRISLYTSSICLSKIVVILCRWSMLTILFILFFSLRNHKIQPVCLIDKLFLRFKIILFMLCDWLYIFVCNILSSLCSIFECSVVVCELWNTYWKATLYCFSLID